MPRQANSSSIAKQVAAIVAEYQATVAATVAARGAVRTAEEARRTKLEHTYLALAKLAHDNSLDPAMCRDMLTSALGAYYAQADFNVPASTACKLRSQLLRAMQPKVRGTLPAIVKPWVDAWEAEGKAKAADAEAETPLRDKFHNRGNTVTQALKNALGKEALCLTPAGVRLWVMAHPRKKRVETPTAPALLRYMQATRSAQDSLQSIRLLARWPQITTMDEIIAETEKAEAAIQTLLLENRA